MKRYSENEETQGEEAYDSEEVSIQPDDGLQPHRPAGFLLCKFCVVRLNLVLVFPPSYGIMVEKGGAFYAVGFFLVAAL